MKKYITFLMLMGHSYTYAQCINDDAMQPCCNGLIKTWPPIAVNTERSPMLNHFDWTQQLLNTYFPNTGYSFNNGPMQLVNPFYTQGAALLQINYYRFPLQHNDPADLDLHPENGWELLHRDFGFDPDEQTYTYPFHQRPGPYMILYNKHTGLLRFLGSFDLDPQDSMVTNIEFKGPYPVSVPSGLLMNHNTVLRALDQKTEEHRVSRQAPYPIGKQFFVADFPMAYDPCVCHYESELSINFNTLNNSSVYMEGRLTGTLSPLKSGGQFGRDFLTSVKRDGFTVNGGATIYNQVDTLVAKFKGPPALNGFEKAALDQIGSGLKQGAKEGDKWLNGVLSPYAKNVILTLADVAAPPGFKLGLNLFAQGANMITSSITPAKPAVPNVQVIEGEMALTGTITDPTALGAGEIYLKVPGSKNSNNPNLHWTNYPAYNEALGLFALLKTPRLYIEQGTVPGQYIKGDKLYSNLIYTAARFKIAEPLQYTFNPAAEIDLEETRMYAAIETDMARPYNNYRGDFRESPYARLTGRTTYMTDFYPINCLQDMCYNMLDSLFLFLPRNMNSSTVPVRATDDGKITLAAPVSPELSFAYFSKSMQSPWDLQTETTPAVLPVRWSKNSPVRLKIMIEYVFKKNAFGKVNRTIQLLTYPLELVEGHPPLPGADEYNLTVHVEENPHDPTTKLSLYGGFLWGYPIPMSCKSPDQIAPVYKTVMNYTASGIDEVEAWNKIYVDGLLQSTAGGLLTVKAGEEIELGYGTEIKTNTEIRLEFPSNGQGTCGAIEGPRPAPVSAEAVKSFCTGTIYQANNYAAKRAQDSVITAPQKLPPSFQSRIYPNPAGNAFKVLLQAEQNTKAGISIYDMQGRLLFRSDTMPIAKGNSEWPFELELANGVYFVNVQEQSNTVTHKLIIAH